MYLKAFNNLAYLRPGLELLARCLLKTRFVTRYSIVAVDQHVLADVVGNDPGGGDPYLGHFGQGIS